jgi:hypothetical protein
MPYACCKLSVGWLYIFRMWIYGRYTANIRQLYGRDTEAGDAVRISMPRSLVVVFRQRKARHHAGPPWPLLWPPQRRSCLARNASARLSSDLGVYIVWGTSATPFLANTKPILAGKDPPGRAPPRKPPTVARQSTAGGSIAQPDKSGTISRLHFTDWHNAAMNFVLDGPFLQSNNKLAQLSPEGTGPKARLFVWAKDFEKGCLR